MVFNKQQNTVLLGSTSIARDKHSDFHINAKDLDEHFYILGRSGTGKSNLLLQMAIGDMQRGVGVCFIDPIGDASEMLLSHVPPERDKDVVYLDVGDSE